MAENGRRRGVIGSVGVAGAVAGALLLGAVGMAFGQEGGGADAGAGVEGGGGDGGEETGVLGGAVAGDVVLVRTGSGREVRGELRRVIRGDGGSVIVAVDGELASVALEEVVLVRVEETAYRRYVTRRLRLEDGDIAGRLALVRWLEGVGMHHEGLEEVEALLRDDPGNPAAQRLRRVLVALVELEESVAEGDGDGDGGEGGGARDGDGVRLVDGRRMRRPTREELPRLTESQVNLIRVYELDLDDAPRVEVPAAVVDELLLRYARSPLIPSTREGREAFRALSGEEILDVMFRLRARELYPRVVVREDPASMEAFRDDVHTRWLVGRCASTRCHGGVDAGRFQLVSTRRASSQTVYTNYYILKEYVGRDGVSKMLDFEDPELSLLVQMGLPREEALYPHPDVRGWKASFRDREARSFRRAVRWVDSLVKPRPEYRLAYETPQARWELREELARTGGVGGGDASEGGGGEGGGGGGAAAK